MGLSVSNVTAGNDAINILAARNQMNALNSDKSKSSQIGLAVEMGGLEGASVGITGGKSRSKNNSISKEQIWSYSTITAGENVNLISGGDTNIIGAHLDAETINASVGNDLNIASPQNTSKHLEFGESSTPKFAIGPQVMVGGKKDKHGQITRTEHINASSLSADEINLVAKNDINITAANVVATDDLNLLSHAGNIAISAGKTTDTGLQSNSSTRLGPLPSEGGISSTVGIDKLTQNSFEASEQAIGSTVGSLGGNVNIMAKEGNYTQTGSDVIVLKGDINILAQEITIKEAQESTRLFQTMQQSRLGITTGVSSPIISLIQQIERLAENAENTEDDRTRALAVGAAGLSIYNNYGDLKQAVGQGAGAMSGVKGAIASLKFSVSLGSSKSQSQEMEYSQTASSSNVSAAGNVNLVATGKDGVGSTPEVPVKTGGNITIQGSNVTAGNDATLIANDKINILAAYNVQGEAFKEKSSSASVGVGVSIGQQTGFGIDLAGSGAKGHRIEADQSWTYSHVKSGNTTTLISGGDTNIIGGQVIGNRVQAEIGGDLNIQSLQNTSLGKAQSKSTGASVSIGIGTYSSIGGDSSKAKSHGEYASVVEYAGIMAGSGGFQINVKGNTDLKGAIIASTTDAITQGKNELTTGSLTTSDLLNFNSSGSEGSSLSMGLTLGEKGVGWGEEGSKKISASPPMALAGKKDDKEYSITLSGISGGKITITDEAEQQKRTGQTAQEAIDAVNTNVLTGMSTGGLIKDWDVEKQLKEMQANIDITKEFIQEGGTLATNLGLQEKQKKDDAEKKLNDPSLNLTPEEKANYQAIVDGKTLWQMGDTGRLVITSVLTALGGNVSGSSADLLQSAAINAIQGLGAQAIKELLTHYGKDGDKDTEAMRAALQAMLACAGASAQGSSCGSGALGAGAGVILNQLINELKGENSTLTAKEKEDRLNLVNTIIGGITLGVGGDVQVAITAATLEMENNYLAEKDFGKLREKEKKYKQDCAGTLAGSSACQKLKKEIDQGIEDAQWIISKIPLEDKHSTNLGVNDILAESVGGSGDIDVAVGDIIRCYSSSSGYCQVSSETSYRDGGTQWKLVPISQETAQGHSNENWRELGGSIINTGSDMPLIPGLIGGTYEAALGETLLGHELSAGERFLSGLGAGLDLVGIGLSFKQIGRAPSLANKGSTGRNTPANIKEKLALEEAMANPSAGREIRVPMNDPRWHASDGWVKMAQNINGVEVHYVRNKKTGSIDDFKFK